MNRSNRRLFGVLALLVLIASLLPLGSFLAGALSGGGKRADPSHPQHAKADPGTLRVTVLSAVDQSPIEGAHILVRGLASGEADMRSDTAGQATVEGLGAGPVHVLASHGDSLAGAWTDPQIENEILLAVAPQQARSGRVAHEDGKPARAIVRLLGSAGEELERTRTDADGKYRLPDDPAAASISVEPDRGAPAVVVRGDVVVTQGREHAGKLLGTGKGKLQIYGWVVAQDEDRTLVFRTGWKVDQDGAFRGRLPEGARAWATFDGLPVRIAEGDIELPKRTLATGSVTRADGTAATGAQLHFRPLLDGDIATPLPGLRVETDKHGKFDATGFADVRYIVEVRAPGCATRIVTDVRPAAGPFDVKLDAGFQTGGIVVDGHGLPVPGADVRAACFPEKQGERPLLRTRADQKGRFQFDGLGGDYCRIQVRAEGHYPTTLDARRDARALRVILQRR